MAQAPLDIPFAAPRVLAAMETSFVNAKVTPNGDSKLAYSLALPREWAYSKRFGPVPDAPFETRGLGFFAHSAEPTSPVIAVTLTPVLYEIPIDAWIRGRFGADGWGIVSAQWFPGPCGLFYDLTGIRVTDGVEYVQRTSVRNDGARIFCVNTFCPRSAWDEVKEIFWAAHVTFELLAGTKKTQMEPWLSAAGKSPDFQVAYPISWSAQPAASAPQGVSAVDLRLVDTRHEKLFAYLQVKAEHDPAGDPESLERLQALTLSKFEKGGITLAGPLEPSTDRNDPRTPAVEGWLGGATGRGRLSGGDVAVRMGFIRQAGITVSMSMISPTIGDDTLAALRAQRTFEIARDTLELG
jgi:hypothetical protein